MREEKEEDYQNFLYDADTPYLLLPHHFKHIFNDIKSLLQGYLDATEPKPFNFYNLLRDIL